MLSINNKIISYKLLENPTVIHIITIIWNLKVDYCYHFKGANSHKYLFMLIYVDLIIFHKVISQIEPIKLKMLNLPFFIPCTQKQNLIITYV